MVPVSVIEKMIQERRTVNEPSFARADEQRERYLPSYRANCRRENSVFSIYVIDWLLVAAQTHKGNSWMSLTVCSVMPLFPDATFP